VPDDEPGDGDLDRLSWLQRTPEAAFDSGELGAEEVEPQQFSGGEAPGCGPWERDPEWNWRRCRSMAMKRRGPNEKTPAGPAPGWL
jgi:hypothetical protein